MRVYVDGQNLLYKVAEILIDNGLIKDKNELVDFDIVSLFEKIFDGQKLEIVFFGAKVKVVKHFGDDIYRKSLKFSDTSRRLRNSLNRQKITFVESGQLKVRDSDDCKKCKQRDYRFQEKGVDVGLAVALVEDRLIKKESVQVLVSSDTDLLPAVKLVQASGGKVYYVGFSDKTTKALVAIANKTEIIRDSEVVEAYKRASLRTGRGVKK